MKKTKEGSDKTREALIEAALLVFGRVGVEMATVEEIARSAGVTQGAFYHHFKNKYEVYLRLLEIRADLYKEVIRECFKPETPAILRIRNYMITVIQRGIRDKRFRSFNEMILQKSDNLEEILQKLEPDTTKRQLSSQIFFDTIEEGISSGDISPRIHTGFYVVNLFVFVQGVITFEMINPNLLKLDEIAEGLVDTFLLSLQEHKSFARLGTEKGIHEV